MLNELGVLLAKKETNYGEDPTPAPASDAVMIEEPALTVVGDPQRRNLLRLSLSQIKAFVGGRKYVTLSFKTEIKGSGAAATPAEWGVLLLGCKKAETITTEVEYDPVSSGDDSIAMYLYFDGILHKILGARGNLSVDLPVGDRGLISWEFFGKYQDPTDAANPASITIDAVDPPGVVNSSFTIGGYAAIIGNMNLNMGNRTVVPPDANDTHGIGVIKITGREPIGSLDPEAVLEATNPFWADWKAGNEKALTIEIGTVVGNIVKFEAPKCQYGTPKWAERDGYRIYELPLLLNGNAGDDELKITTK